MAEQSLLQRPCVARPGTVQGRASRNELAGEQGRPKWYSRWVVEAWSPRDSEAARHDLGMLIYWRVLLQAQIFHCTCRATIMAWGSVRVGNFDVGYAVVRLRVVEMMGLLNSGTVLPSAVRVRSSVKGVGVLEELVVAMRVTLGTKLSHVQDDVVVSASPMRSVGYQAEVQPRELDVTERS